MVNFNGNLLLEGTLFLDHKNRGLHYGDALFESLRAIESNLVFWEEHYLKLMASMRILRMEIPMNFTMEFLEEQILKTIQENDLAHSSAIVHIMIFRNGSEKLLPENNEVSFCVEISELGFTEYPYKDAKFEVELFKDFYVSSDMLSTLDTNNKMLNVAGSIFAKENDYNDCLLLNHKKMIVGSLRGNLFLVAGKTVKTAPLGDGCSNLVVRDKVLKIIGDSDDYELEENSISPFELQRADELFITNIEEGLIPITKYRKKEYNTLNSKKLLEKLNELIRSEIPF